MKNIYLIMLLMFCASIYSCKEDEKAIPESGTVNVINVVSDVGAIKGNFSGINIAWSSIIPTGDFGTGKLYYAPAGNSNMKVVPALDTNVVLFNAARTIQSKVYTLYLTGTKADVDTMFREEINFPFIATGANIPPPADSVVNVRFVNLSTSSPALKIKLAIGTANEVNNLSYKSIGTWKGFPNRTDFTEYNFEVRNAATDELLTTYTFYAMATNRFKNVALVIRGAFGSGDFGVSEINYF
jgi:hypothetical protein